MAALFLMLLIATCLVLWLVAGLGAAFRRYDRTVRRDCARYDFVAERRRAVDRRAFKSRMGVR